jgi:hypothetical protein
MRNLDMIQAIDGLLYDHQRWMVQHMPLQEREERLHRRLTQLRKSLDQLDRYARTERVKRHQRLEESA